MITRQEFMDMAPIPKTELYKACARMRTPGLSLEFGVWKGGSLNYLADLVHPDKIYGFDSFEGLPEEWDTGREFHQKGHFATKLPEVRPNAELVPGWFSKTLPEFLEKHPGDIALLHIDSDIYSSAKFILESLDHRIVPGTLIIFDELCDFTEDGAFYPKWREGEWKAVSEWLKEKKRSIRPLFRNEDSRAAVLVLK